MATHFNICLIDPHQLSLVIKNRVDNVLILDSRSFLEYNSSHVVNAVNVGCAKLMKRRLQQDKLSIKDFLAHSCHWDVEPETDIIVYDQATTDPSYLSPDSFMSVFLHKLLPYYNSVNVLKGGYLGFQACYPNLCETEKMKFTALTSLSQPCLPISDHGPTRILSFLYLGSQHDALNKEVLLNHNITYELNVSTNCPKPDFIQEAHFMRIPVIDNYSEKLLPHFPQAFQFLDKVRESGGCALVHCLAGISRSATVAIAYIMKHMKMSSDEAYRYVKSKRATISPNFNFLGQLLEYEGQLQMEKVLSPKSRAGSVSQSACSSALSDSMFCFDHTKLSQVPVCAGSPDALQDITFNPCSNGARSTNERFTSDQQTLYRKSNFELPLNRDRGTVKPDHWTVRSLPALSLKELNFMPCQASLTAVERSATLKCLNISLGKNSWYSLDHTKVGEDANSSSVQMNIAPKQDSDSMLFNSASDSKLDYDSLNLWPSQDATLSLSQVSFDSKDYNRSDSTSTSGLGSEGSDLTDSWNEYHNGERETDTMMDEGYSTVPTGDEEYQRRKILGLEELSMYAKYDSPDFHDETTNCGMLTSDRKYMGFSMERHNSGGGGNPVPHPITNRSSSFNDPHQDNDVVEGVPLGFDPKCDRLYRARSCPGIMFSDPLPLSPQEYDHSVVPSVALRTTKKKPRKAANQNRYSCSSLDYMDHSSQMGSLKSWTNASSSDSVPPQMFTHSMIQVS